MTGKRGPLDQVGCVPFASGSAGQVVMRNSVVDTFKSLESKQKARLLSNAELWAGGQTMTQEQFNHNEGRCQHGSINKMLQALKVHKVRLYGFTRHFLGKKTFIIVDADPAKKQDRANPRILARAKQHVIDFEKEFGGKYE